MNIGIYKIENTISNNMYIGQSSNLIRRFKEHQKKLDKNIHANRHLQRAWNKHGKNNFIFKTLIYCEKQELTYYEQALVDQQQPAYNVCKKCVNSTLGIIHSEIAKQRMSAAHKGEKHNLFGKHPSVETLEKMSKSHIGKLHSEESKKKISISKKGKPVSEERRMKMFKRRTSDETKIKISNSLHLYWIRR